MSNQIAETTTIPTIAQLQKSVRRNLGLPSSALVDITQVSEFSNINYVYRGGLEDKNIYLKVAPRQLRNFPVEAPQGRETVTVDGRASRIGWIGTPNIAATPNDIDVNKPTASGICGKEARKRASANLATTTVIA